MPQQKCHLLLYPHTPNSHLAPDPMITQPYRKSDQLVALRQGTEKKKREKKGEKKKKGKPVIIFAFDS